MREEELQGNGAVESGVPGLVHHTHPAATEPFEDRVMGNGLAFEAVGRPAFRGQAFHLRCSALG